MLGTILKIPLVLAFDVAVIITITSGKLSVTRQVKFTLS